MKKDYVLMQCKVCSRVFKVRNWIYNSAKKYKRPIQCVQCGSKEVKKL